MLSKFKWGHSAWLNVTRPKSLNKKMFNQNDDKTKLFGLLPQNWPVDQNSSKQAQAITGDWSILWQKTKIHFGLLLYSL